jgi:hypothetical protein
MHHTKTKSIADQKCHIHTSGRVMVATYLSLDCSNLLTAATRGSEYHNYVMAYYSLPLAATKSHYKLWSTELPVSDGQSHGQSDNMK